MAAPRPSAGGGSRAARAAVVAAMAVVGMNLWTGAPLLALWIGSRVQGHGPPTMGAVFAVVVCLAVAVLGLTRVLAVLGAVHDEQTGHGRQARRHLPWLRSMRGEREQAPGVAPVLTALERTLVVVVVAAVLAFEIWFFFFSSSPIDQRSGRASRPAAVATARPSCPRVGKRHPGRKVPAPACRGRLSGSAASAP